MIWAFCEFNGCELSYLPALNPGAYGGRTWFIEFTGDVPIWLVLEAESVCDAIVVLNSHPEWGDMVHVAIDENEDEPEAVICVQFVRVHGDPESDPPYPVRYHDEGFPEQGIDPRQFANAQWN